MGFTSALAALLATIPSLTFALALPDTSLTYPTPFCSLTGPPPYNGYSCVWGNPSPAGAMECTCNMSPPSLPGPQYELASFYTGENYAGFQFNAYGGYNTCYDLPYLWNKRAESMKIGWDTPGCWVYTEPDCKGPFAVIDSPGITKFIDSYENGVQSFQCDPPPPPPPPKYDPTTTAPKSTTAPPKSTSIPKYEPTTTAPKPTTTPPKSTSTPPPKYDPTTSSPKQTTTAPKSSSTPKPDPTSNTPKPTTAPPKSTSTTPKYDPVPTTTSPKSTPKLTVTPSPYYP